MGFYRGVVARTEAPGIDSSIYVDSKSIVFDKGSRIRRSLGWASFGIAVAGGIVSGVFYGAARVSYSEYHAATDRESAKALHRTSDERLRISQGFLYGAVGFGLLGGTLLIVDIVKNKGKVRGGESAALAFRALMSLDPSGGQLGFCKTF
jgi:hypothetical protein